MFTNNSIRTMSGAIVRSSNLEALTYNSSERFLNWKVGKQEQGLALVFLFRPWTDALPSRSLGNIPNPNAQCGGILFGRSTRSSWGVFRWSSYEQHKMYMSIHTMGIHKMGISRFSLVRRTCPALEVCAVRCFRAAGRRPERAASSPVHRLTSTRYIF